MWRWSIKYFIVDAETGIKNRGPSAIGDMKASPYHYDNKIVLLGERHKGVNNLFNPWAIPFGPSYPSFMEVAKGEPVLLVGANFAFDLKYLNKTYDITMKKVINNIHIWDVQQVAYLLSGQTHTYPSLDEMSAEIGLELKDEKIKEYWKDDIDTELIPDEELREYLDRDLENTEAVFRYQYEIVSKIPALFELVRVKMDDLLCLSMMEENGMAFDLVYAHSQAEANDVEISSLTKALQDQAEPYFTEGFDFNPMSNEHVSLLLFGGDYKLRQAVEIKDEAGNPVVYKTGQKKGLVKTRMEDVQYFTTGIGYDAMGTANAKGIYPVGDDVLKALGANHTPQQLARLRELTKENETYYRGYAALVWPDGRIHPNINSCSTRTGRQSCTKPNLQNVTRDE